MGIYVGYNTTAVLVRSYNSTTKRVEFHYDESFTIKSILPAGPVTHCNTLVENHRMRMMFGLPYDNGFFNNCGSTTSRYWNMWTLGSWTFSNSQEYLVNGLVGSVDAKFYNENIRGKYSYAAFRGYEYDNSMPSSCSRWVIGFESGISPTPQTSQYCQVGMSLGSWLVGRKHTVGGSEPPLQPAKPSISGYNNCVDDKLSTIINLVSPNTTDVDYFSVRRSDTINGTYIEIGQIAVGDTEYIDDNYGKFYKVFAVNTLYESIASDVLFVENAPIISDDILYGEYPVLSFTAETTNFCEVESVYWYLDDDLFEITTGSTLTGVLPDTLKHQLTAKFYNNGQLSNVSNIVNVQFGTIITSGFTSNGSMVIPSGFNRMDYLLIAGGGAGGSVIGGDSRSCQGGGGGAGGFLSGTTVNPVAGTYNVVIGAGGVNSNGGNSTFYGYTATGGGRGGISKSGDGGYANAGSNGGSGGGGGISNTFVFTNVAGAGGTGVSGQGNNGKGGFGSSNSIPGGGGGAGGAGSSVDRSGGIGKSSDISGTLKTYSVGGDGGRIGAGNGIDADANTGNGGSGARTSSTSYNGGNGGSGVVYVKLYNVYPDPIDEPSGLTASGTTCSESVLTWINNSTENVDGIYIQTISGSTWTTIDEVSSGTTSYNLTGLTPLTNYIYRVVAYNDLYIKPSTSVSLTTVDARPQNLIAIPFNNKASLSWNFLCDYGTEIEIRSYNSTYTSYDVIDTINSDDVEYELIDLDWNTTYYIGVVRIGSEYPAFVSFETPNPTPTDLIVDDITYSSAVLSWYSNASVCDTIIQRWNGSWQDIDTIQVDEIGYVSYNLTGLTQNTQYTYRVVLSCDDDYPSNSVTFSTPIAPFPKPFCDGTNYSVIQNTCGNADGAVEIDNELYLEFYDFTLTDSFGNSYNHVNGIFGNLDTGYYTLTATPKPQYWYHYGREACVINWIPIEPEDTTIAVDSVSVRPEQGGEIGRVVVTITDSHSTYNVWFYDVFGNQIKFISGTTSKQFVYEGFGCVYLIIKNTDNGCGLLLGPYCIPKENTRSIGGLKHIFISPYEGLLDVNYWKSDDEDFFVQTLDPSFFYSTKIKSVDTALQWYSLPIHNRLPSFEQKMVKERQGIGFIDTLKVPIAHQNVQKLNDLMLLFGNKFVIIVQDANNMWWISGYKIPAELKITKLLTNSRGASNEYQLEFESISTDNIITAIDSQWVKDNIL